MSLEKKEIFNISDTKLESKQFYKSLYVIVLPIVLQNIISAAVSSADVIMLSYVNQTAIAAASLASQIQFIMFMFYTGLSSGLVMLTSQYWGKKDEHSIRTLMGIALKMSGSIGFLFFVLTFFVPKQLMLIFTDDLRLVEYGAEYLRVVSVSYFFLAISQVFQAVLRSLEHVKTVTCITFVALGLNIFLNAVFIFGLFGAPKLGLFGVALATTIARAVELVISVFLGHRIKDVKLDLKTVLLKNPVLFHDFIKYSFPAIGNEIVWGAAWATYSAILGHLGEDIVAANSVVGILRNLGGVFCFGMAYGGAVLIGKEIGEQQMELAKRNSSRLIKVTAVAGVVGALIMVALKPTLPYLAKNLTEGAAYYRDILLYVNCFSLIGAAINTGMICGTFRAGGDSKFGLYLDFFCMWCFSVPLGFFVAFVLKLPPLWVYIILYLDEFEKMPFIIWHYKKGKWLKNITR